MDEPGTGQNGGERAGGGADVTLEARPERRLIRPNGSFRHVDFAIRVGPAPVRAAADRAPLTLALVLDRSGSMAGGKLDTAKRAALAVLDQLDERDRAAVVVYDNQIDVLQEAAPVSAVVKNRVRAALAQVQPRASTALHEGWLTGCRAIAGDGMTTAEHGLARCFLLTDGLANVGLADPEQIAAEAAGIRRHAGIGTSTFGIGEDYDERLLAPLATAGGGQFHHLRTAAEIGRTFSGELGDLLLAAAVGVRLEIEADAGIQAQVVTSFWTEPAPSGRGWMVAIGDLLPNEERHVVVRFKLPRLRPEGAGVRGRVLWTSGGVERATPWQSVAFSYADHGACDVELRDPGVMHWVGLHHADLAQREATELNRQGDYPGARERLKRVARRIAEYAERDPELLATVQELERFEQEAGSAPMTAMAAKEAWFGTLQRSRGQRDYR